MNAYNNSLKHICLMGIRWMVYTWGFYWDKKAHYGWLSWQQAAYRRGSEGIDDAQLETAFLRSATPKTSCLRGNCEMWGFDGQYREHLASRHIFSHVRDLQSRQRLHRNPKSCPKTKLRMLWGQIKKGVVDQNKGNINQKIHSFSWLWRSREHRISI